MSVPGQPGNQRAAAPWGQGHFWGQFSSPNDLVNVAGAAYQIDGDLQAGDVAFVVNSGQLFICGDPTPGAAIWTAIGGGLVVSAPNLFVDVATGNDSNDGLTPATALATLQAAVDLVPLTLLANVVIHVASGTYTFPFIGPRTLFSGSLAIYGDGGGQGGDDGFTELLASTAAIAGSDATNVTVTGPLVADDFNGKTIEILTGAAANDRRTIRDNTATVITPVQDFSAAVAATDTFRIVESAVLVEVPSVGAAQPGSPALIAGVGSPAGDAMFTFTTANDPALLLINLGFRSDEVGIFSFLRITSSRVIMAGCDFTFTAVTALGPEVDPFSQLLLGVDIESGPLDQFFQLPVDLGLAASNTEWLGWGLLFNGTSAFEFSNVLGYWVFLGGRLAAVPGTTMRILGGAVHATTTITLNMNAAFIIGQKSTVEIGPPTRPFIVRADVATNAAAGIAVLADSLAVIGNTEVTLTTSGHAILVGADDHSDQNRGYIGAARVQVIDDCVLDTPGVALGASYGGSAFYNGAGPTVLNAGTECATYTGTFGGAAVATTTFGALTDGAAILAVAGDGTKIMRLPS